MIVLTIRTDKPEAEIGLYDGDQQLVYERWQAHRELSDTIHKQIEKVLQSQSTEWQAVEGIVCYKGPGSFTGLRIGLSVANALAHSLNIPAVAIGGDDWQQAGIHHLHNGETDKVLMPEYGGEINITQQKK